MAFIDQGEFEAMQTPIGRRVLHCGKDQFHAKMMVSTLTVCGISLLKHSGRNKKERIRKMAFS